MAVLVTRPQITEIAVTTTPTKVTFADDTTIWEFRVRAVSSEVWISPESTPSAANSAVRTAVGQEFKVPDPLSAERLADDLYVATDSGNATLELVQW